MRLLLSAGPGHSHIAPMLPLATAARDGGHDVRFVTGEGAAHQIEKAGLTAVEIGPPLARSFAGLRDRFGAPPADASSDERMAHMVEHYMVRGSAADRLDELLALIDDFGPDLVVTNVAEWGAPLAAAVAGVPYAVHAIGPPKPAAIMAAGRAAAEEIVAGRGATLPDHAGVPYLDIWPEALTPAGEEWEFPSRWPLRPVVAEAVPGPPPAILTGLPRERTVYLTLGTTHNTREGVMESMVSALREVPVNVVATVGRDGDPARFGSQPDHVRITDFVPQHELLPHVAAVLCHGGTGTVLGALGHGVPLVLAPLATDQFDVADQVVAAGAGRIAEPDDFGTALEALLADPAAGAAATAIGTELRAQPPPEQLLSELLRYAGGA